MKIEVNGWQFIEVEDRPTSRGHQVIDASAINANPAPGKVAFIERPRIGAPLWVCYARTKEDGSPDLETVNRIELKKSIATAIPF